MGGLRDCPLNLPNLFMRTASGTRLDFITRITDIAHRRFLLRAYVAAGAAAVIVPILAITWWLAHLTASSERVQIEENVLQQASDIARSIDREIAASQNM